MPPESIAHYRISSTLGKGAMGEVYRATDSKLGREVAIKLIPEDFARDATRMARFTREAQVLASLNHPNIAAIYGVEDRALIMELVEGQTLSERIKRGAIPLDETIDIARQIAEGLEAAHDKGVVHRDLKPANIKITPGGTVKLLDFGLAKADGPSTGGTSVDDAATIAVTTTGAGMILGTAAYMSPEQARGRNVDRRADIWAFGVILYEMLTGEQMFEGDTVTDVLASVVRQDPDLARVPEKVRPLLQRCLEKDPRRRLRDAGDAMLLLDSAPTATAVAAQTSKTPLLALGGAAALLSLALAGVSYTHFRETPPAADVVRFQVGLPESVNFTQFGTSAVSPDGRKIVFAAYGYDGNPRLWLRSLDSAVATPIQEATINQQTAALFWSPDSKSVAYGDSKQLKKIDVAGGPAQALADIAPAIGGSWNADGTMLVGSTSGIMKLSANGGTPTPVTKPASPQEAHAHPVFLPDGRHFLYMRGLPPGKRTINVGDLNAAPDAQSTTPILTNDFGVAVTQAGAGSPLVLFLRDGTLLAQEFDMTALALTGSPVTVMEQVAGVLNAALGHFSVSTNGMLVFRSISGNSRQLTWYNRQGDITGRPAEPGPYGTMKVSPDGSKAAVVQNDPRQPGNSDIWVVDLSSGASTRFTFEPGVDAQPVWSPDGRYLAWQSDRSKTMGIYRKAADGSGADELLYAASGLTNLTDWTHNGYLIFTIGGNVQALPAEGTATGSRTPIPVIEGPAQERGAYVSPDNRWIAYLSNETGRDEIYVQPFSAGGNKAAGKWMVSRGTRGMARWRGDSKELMFVNGEGAVVSVDVAPGAAFQAGAPKKLFQMPLELLSNANPGTLADATRDAQRLLLVMPVQENAQRELAVVLNWEEGLKK